MMTFKWTSQFLREIQIPMNFLFSPGGNHWHGIFLNIHEGNKTTLQNFLFKQSLNVSPHLHQETKEELRAELGDSMWSSNMNQLKGGKINCYVLDTSCA